MAKKILTDKVVRALKAVTRQEDYWDESFKMRRAQFAVRVYPSGRKEYFIRYRTKDGERPTTRLGDTSSVSLAEARDKARKFIGQVYNGGNPAAEREAIRAARTFGELFEEFIRHMKQKVDAGVRKSRTINEYERLLKKEVLPSFGNRKICDITRADIIAILNYMAYARKCISQARRLRANLSSIFSFAVQRSLITHSPCTNLPKGEKAKAKERFLTENEIVQFWVATSTVSDSMATIYRLILLTGQRPGEVTGMRWEEIKDGVWTIPGDRVKNRRDQIIPLSTHAQELLALWRKNLVRRQARCMREARYIDRGLVFPARHAGGATTYINKTCRKMVDREKLAKFTPHDLRRTAASHIRRLGFGRDTVSLILNHTVRGVLAHYDHYQGLKEKTDALEAWGQEVRRLISGVSSREAVV
jgi:integrase